MSGKMSSHRINMVLLLALCVLTFCACSQKSSEIDKLKNKFEQLKNRSTGNSKPFISTSELRASYAPLGSYASFNVIREMASHALDGERDEIKQVTLRRIKDNCDHIKEIFDGIHQREEKYKKAIFDLRAQLS